MEGEPAPNPDGRPQSDLGSEYEKPHRMLRTASLALVGGFGAIALFPSGNLASTREKLEEQRRIQLILALVHMRYPAWTSGEIVRSTRD